MDKAAKGRWETRVNAPGATACRTRQRRRRGCLAVSLVVTAVVLILLVIAVVGLLRWIGSTHSEPVADPVIGDTSPVTPELDFTGFDPTLILSDAQLYRADAMSEDQIRSFIAQWNEGCQPGTDGTPCLADYRADTDEQAADEYCPGGYAGAGGEDAAEIIWKTSQSCGINPQVLLVMLQKEQGLITASGWGLTDSRYGIAMGYGCPDGSNCDEQYFGFQRQVWYAARQFQKYQAAPQSYQIVPGVPTQLRFGPEEGCDGTQIVVQNQATASLYDYTPYQPEPALVGGGSNGMAQCSGQGNLNFYAYFKAWFGNPTE